MPTTTVHKFNIGLIYMGKLKNEKPLMSGWNLIG
jgi:hypothetical protein